MTKKIISNVQEFLTIVGEDRVYQIVNVELLLNCCCEGTPRRP